jgi:hypothetical protein
MLLPKLLIISAATLAVAAPAHAATDTIVATTAKPTRLAAGYGKVLYSAWDGSEYRLTRLGGKTLGVPGAKDPFTVDIGKRKDGHVVAVYARDGRLRMYDLDVDQERSLKHTAGATVGSISGDRLVYATNRGIYAGHINGTSDRVTGKEAFSLDARNSRFAFTGTRQWSHEPWLATQTSLTRLTHVPGGGASPAFLDALNPTFAGTSIYWMLTREGEKPYSEIHRFNRKLDRDERVDLQIPGTARGFAYEGGRAYYSLGTEIHQVTGLDFEKAPRIRMY